MSLGRTSAKSTAARRIEGLIAGDDLAGALKELASFVEHGRKETRRELLALQARLSALDKQSRRNLISDADEQRSRNEIRYTALELLAEVEERPDTVSTAPPELGHRTGTARSDPNHRPVVFISYHHGDRAMALRLQSALMEKGLAVMIDVDTIGAGEDIATFIRRSVRDSNVTLSLVSNQSLLSPWVAMETINTFFGEGLTESRKFIACYVDDDFFHRKYRSSATKKIDAQLTEIDRLISEHAAAKLDTNDLDTEKARLFELRNNLGVILRRLRDSLSLDIRDDHFDDSIGKIATAAVSQ